MCIETEINSTDTHTPSEHFKRYQQIFGTHIRTVWPDESKWIKSCELQSVRLSPKISSTTVNTHTHKHKTNTILNKNQLEMFRSVHYLLSNNQLIQALCLSHTFGLSEIFSETKSLVIKFLVFQCFRWFWAFSEELYSRVSWW